jgi:Ca2+-transporting ATPase
MQRPPRSPSAPILSRFVLWRVGLVAVFIVAGVFGVFTWLILSGAETAYARTAAVNTVVAFEIVYLLSVRRLHDPGWTGLLGARAIWVAIALVAVGQIAFTYLPVMNAVFETVPLALGTWLVIVPVSATIFMVSEWEKVLVRGRRARRAA